MANSLNHKFTTKNKKVNADTNNHGEKPQKNKQPHHPKTDSSEKTLQKSCNTTESIGSGCYADREEMEGEGETKKK